MTHHSSTQHLGFIMSSYSHKHGSMLSYSTPYNIMRSPSSYIAYNDPTLMNRHPKIKETNILLPRYLFLKITYSSSNVNKKPFEIKLKQILYSDPFGENNFVTLKPTTIPPSIHPFSSHHILLVLKSKINLHLTKHVLMAICFCQLSFLPLLATLAEAIANEKNIQTVLSSKIALAA